MPTHDPKIKESDDLWALLAQEATPKPPVLIDRSLLERYSVCPFQGAAVETGLVSDVSKPADSGTEGHSVLGTVTRAFAIDGVTRIGELIDLGIDTARMTRCDVQPDVLEGVRYFIARFARWLVYLPGGGIRNPADVKRFQGGEGERSGQVSWDILPETPERGPVRLTSEIDLLMAGGSDAELEETDFKTGHTPWTAASVRDAFQFRFHALLLFKTYPELEQLYVRVWPTRPGHQYGGVPSVRYTQRDADDFHGICLRALKERDAALCAILATEPAETWAERTKCTICPAANDCPYAVKATIRLTEEPQEFLESFAVRSLALEQDGQLLKAWVKQHGELRSGGWAFGVKAPKTTRAPSPKLYEAKT